MVDVDVAEGVTLSAGVLVTAGVVETAGVPVTTDVPVTTGVLVTAAVLDGVPDVDGVVELVPVNDGVTVFDGVKHCSWLQLYTQEEYRLRPSVRGSSANARRPKLAGHCATVAFTQEKLLYVAPLGPVASGYESRYFHMQSPATLTQVVHEVALAQLAVAVTDGDAVDDAVAEEVGVEEPVVDAVLAEVPVVVNDDVDVALTEIETVDENVVFGVTEGVANGAKVCVIELVIVGLGPGVTSVTTVEELV